MLRETCARAEDPQIGYVLPRCAIPADDASSSGACQRLRPDGRGPPLHAELSSGSYSKIHPEASSGSHVVPVTTNPVSPLIIWPLDGTVNAKFSSRGPTTATGRGLVRSLDRVAQIAGLHLGAVEVAGAGVPTRRLIELARTGFEAKAPKLAALKQHRKIATLLATVRWLEVTATDDALELFDVFMSSELVGRAGRSSDKAKPIPPGYPAC